MSYGVYPLGTSVTTVLFLYGLERMHWSRRDRRNRYGDVMRYPFSPIVDIYCPADIGTLLRADSVWPSRPVLPIIAKAIKRGEMTPSISHLNGEPWGHVRSKMQRIFLKPTAALQFFDKQLDVCIKFIDRLYEEQEQRSYVTDFRSWACRYAAESVGQLLIGCNMRSFDDVEDTPGKRLCASMDRLFKLTALGLLPSPWTSKVYKDWLSEHKNSLILIQELINTSAFRELKIMPGRGLESSGNSHVSYSTFFSEMLSRDELSLEEACDFAQELFIAGVESTGNAFTFLVYHLAKNPQVQDKLYSEITKYSPSIRVNTGEYSKMSYLRACVKESMRLSPPVTGTVRITSKDLVLAGYNIPTGTIVNTGSDIICEMQQYFSTPHEYRPERWLGENRQTIQPFSFIPFGHGSRMCIGRRFAEQELLVAAMMMVKNFKIELLDPALSIDRKWKVFYSPDNQVNLKLSKRE